jgi:hypothetical protein
MNQAADWRTFDACALHFFRESQANLVQAKGPPVVMLSLPGDCYRLPDNDFGLRYRSSMYDLYDFLALPCQNHYLEAYRSDRQTGSTVHWPFS